MQWLKKLMEDENGYGSVEVILLSMGAIFIAAAIITVMLPVIQGAHNQAVETFTSINSSGQ